MPSGPASEAVSLPVSVTGAYKPRYKGAWLWAMKEEMKGLKESGTFKELKGLPEGEKAIGYMSGVAVTVGNSTVS